MHCRPLASTHWVWWKERKGRKWMLLGGHWCLHWSCWSGGKNWWNAGDDSDFWCELSPTIINMARHSYIDTNSHNVVGWLHVPQNIYFYICKLHLPDYTQTHRITWKWVLYYLGLIELLINTSIDLNALPEPLLLHHLHTWGRGWDVSGIYFIVRDNQMSHSRLPMISNVSSWSSE